MTLALAIAWMLAALLADECTATYDDGSLGDKAKELSLVRTFNQAVQSAAQSVS